MIHDLTHIIVKYELTLIHKMILIIICLDFCHTSAHFPQKK